MLEEARQALQESLGEGCELPELATPEDLDALNSDDLLFKVWCSLFTCVHLTSAVLVATNGAQSMQIEVLNEEMRKMNPDMSALEVRPRILHLYRWQ